MCYYRFCGVSNSFVKRNAEGAKGTTTLLPVKTTETSGSSRYNMANPSPTLPQPQQKRVEGSSPNIILQSPDVVKDVKSESKPVENKVNVPQLAVNTKKVQTDKKSSGTGGALANMWGRASAKPKAECASAKTNSMPNSSGLFLNFHSLVMGRFGLLPTCSMLSISCYFRVHHLCANSYCRCSNMFS